MERKVQGTEDQRTGPNRPLEPLLLRVEQVQEQMVRGADTLCRAADRSLADTRYLHTMELQEPQTDIESGAAFL